MDHSFLFGFRNRILRHDQDGSVGVAIQISTLIPEPETLDPKTRIQL